MKHKKTLACLLAVFTGLAATACATTNTGDQPLMPEIPVEEPVTPPEQIIPPVEEPAPEEPVSPEPPAETEEPSPVAPTEPEPEEPVKPSEPEPTVPVQKPAKAQYLRVTGSDVNIRSGAGTGYSVLGKAEKNTLFALTGEKNGWYETYCRGRKAYISKKYAALYETEKADADTENVIAEGMKLLGVPYVYGAVRLHDGTGKFLKGFTKEKFDCSSLMQYIFYYGKGALLSLTTRTQVSQGKAVSENNLKRGDLLFFTNASRVNNTGIERIGHVALYLGDGYILHTASDYSKVEPLSAARRNYFICARRV